MQYLPAHFRTLDLVATPIPAASLAHRSAAMHTNNKQCHSLFSNTPEQNNEPHFSEWMLRANTSTSPTIFPRTPICIVHLQVPAHW